MMTLLQAMDDPNLFKPWFKRAKDWIAWRTFIAALFGLRLDAAQQAIFTSCTGRKISPTQPVKEAWMVVGRRGGKSFNLALISVFIAAFSDYRKYLAPGERATIMVIASNKKQARNIMRYIDGLLNDIPMLKRMVESDTKESFDLTNRTTIEVMAASSKSIRGYTIAAAICDEIAFWTVDADASDPDVHVLEALRPAMATIPNAMLLCASSPYAKRGALWEVYHENYAQDTDVLVWQADTRTMNPSITQAYIDKQYKKDVSWAAAEYGAQFRDDLESYISQAVVERATVKGRIELKPETHFHYVGFSDQSGGSGQDSCTAAVCHIDPRTQFVVIDAVREIKPPFSPEAAIVECVKLFRLYRVHKITMDRFAAMFPVEIFAKFGITCLPSELTRSEIYVEMLPLLNSGRLELLDNERANKQLCALERRTRGGARDVVDHPQRGHDDLINSIAGAAVMAASVPAPLIITPEMLAASRVDRRFGNSLMGKPACYF